MTGVVFYSTVKEAIFIGYFDLSENQWRFETKSF